MADKKISQLPLATTPLSGGETLPVVQTGTTVQVSVNDLTAGRSVSASSIANGLGAVGTPSYTFTGDTNTGMWSPAADTIAFSEGGAERMRLDSGGNLLVGKNSPDSAITGHILGPTGNLVTTRDANVCHTLNRNTTDGAIVSYRRDNVAVANITATTTAMTYGISTTSSIAGVDANTVAIRTNSAERMRIDSSGNVAIGTTTLRAKLDCFTTSNFDPSDSAATAAFFARSSGTAGIGNFGGAISFSKPVDGFRPMGAISSVQTTADAEQGGLAFFVHSGTASDDILSERMRITDTGDVGVGETAPDYKLDVNGTFGFTPGASVTPVDNGDVVFELTNNTTLTIKAKGSDGVVRSGTITLA